jgi:hypothetical protein
MGRSHIIGVVVTRFVLIGALALAPLALGTGCDGETATRQPPVQGGEGGDEGMGGSGGRGDASVAGRGGAGGRPDGSTPRADAAADRAAPSTDVADAAVMGGEAGSAVPVAGPWARGVRLGLVEATQSVFIRLGQGEMVVPPEMRNAEIIEGRLILVRAHLVTDAGFTARPLRAVFTLAYDDGSSHSVEDRKMVAGSSNGGQLDSTLNGLFPAAVVKPGGKLSVSVYEEDAGGDPGPEPARPPRFPATGTVDLAIKGGAMILDAVMIPAIGVGGPIDLAPERRKRIEDHLYDVYPVQKVNVRWREPVRFETRIGTAEGFAALRNARTEDGARPYEYYHLLIAVEDTNSRYLGIANGAGTSVSDGPRRIAITFVRKRQADSSVDTISHEMGHNHGRNHPPGCGSDGSDTNFPYPNTGVGVNGLVLSTMKLTAAATFKDLMGYCYPTHLSDYTWNGFARRVRIVSGFPRPAAAPDGGALGTSPLGLRSLQGFQEPGQAPRWGVVAGALVGAGAPVSARRQAVITLGDGSRTTAPVSVQLMSDGQTRELAVDLPPAGELAGVELSIDGERHLVGAADLVGP